MNKDNRRKLWTLIQEAGLYLLGQLPEHTNHPKGRNPYAHVAICVKDHFNLSYKDIPDEKFDEVVKYIEFLKQNPS
jgi:Leucine-rich repeat (LRR) protein